MKFRCLNCGHQWKPRTLAFLAGWRKPKVRDYILDSLLASELDSDVANWAKVNYSKTQIDKAAETLLSDWWSQEDTDLFDFEDQFTKVWNWTIAHSFPLNSFRTALRNHAKRIDPTALVVQRIKRVSAIMLKMERQAHASMRVTQMQDLGGCRVILYSIGNIYTVADQLHVLGNNFDDYIKHPKADGYRSLHIVGQYSARTSKYEAWNGLRIEMQLRSRLQHAAATAVETVDTFTTSRLKFGKGPPDWMRFFSLMGSVLALREGTTPVENTPSSDIELIRELADLTTRLDVHRNFRSWAETLKVIKHKHIIGAKWMMLTLNKTLNQISVMPFAERSEAEQAISDMEKTKGRDIDVVLVWVDSFKMLRRAYPNYYADTVEFLSSLDHALQRFK